MSDQATETMVVDATPARVYDAITDFESYPSWARDLKGVTVEETDDQGRGVRVTFRAAAMGRSTEYTLRYAYAEDPTTVSWTLESGDIMRRLDGSYVLEPADGGARTEVTYDLAVELVIPLPGFVRRRAESKVVHTALRELRAHVER
ncbi:MAG: SRPBCC family protein [Acidimicrobiia bacterium]